MAWGNWWGGGPWGACVAGADTDPPTPQLIDPIDGSVFPDPLYPISLRVLDPSGVDPHLLRVVLTIGGVSLVAVENGEVHPGFKGVGWLFQSIMVGVDHGIDLILVPTAPIPVGSVTITVTAQDAECNEVVATYLLTVDCDPGDCAPILVLPPGLDGAWGSTYWGSGPWGGGLPDGSAVAVPGGGTPAVTTPEIVGVTLGNDEIVLDGVDLATFFFNDNFRDGVVNATLWSVLGPFGVVTEGPVGFSGFLGVDLPATPGTYGGLYGEALNLKGDFHIEASIETGVISKPSHEQVLFAIEARVDLGNMLRLSLILKANQVSPTLRAEVWKFGYLMHQKEVGSGLGALRLGVARYYDTVFADYRAAFFLNGNLLFESFDAPPCQLSPRLYSYTGAAANEIHTRIRSFLSHSVIVFTGPAGADIQRNPVEVTTTRIRGLTPPTRGNWAGAVDLRVSNGSGNGCSGRGFFRYVFPERFVVGRSQPFRPTDSEASITNDLTLRNPGPNIGTGLRRGTPLWPRSKRACVTPSCWPSSPTGVIPPRGRLSPTGTIRTPCSSLPVNPIGSSACS